MSGHHLRRVEELGGAARARLLTKMAGERGEVGDPFGGSRKAYLATFDQLERLVAAVLDATARKAEPGL